jgi:hypothetical protein
VTVFYVAWYFQLKCDDSYEEQYSLRLREHLKSI